MKIKKVLTTSMLCALVCTALPVSKSFADETDKTEVKIERTSIEEVNKSLISSSDKIFKVPSALELAKLEQDNNIYSLVSEEDTKMPELEENSYYVKESTEMKPVLSENEEETIKVEKGSIVKVEMSGDKKAIVSVSDKVGTIDVDLLTKETVEPEKNETEIKNAEEKKQEEKEAGTQKKAPAKKVSLYATENLNVRSDQSSSSSKLGVLSKGEKVNGIDKGEWVEFNFNGKTGYVMKSYLSENKPEVQQPREEKSKKQNNSSSSNNSSRQESQSSNADVDTVVNLALAQVGKPYVWGSANPNVGFDCSGLVYYAYKQVGITLSRSSYSQINYGTRVKSSELRKGDLVFFNNGGGRISHVGIYIGNNKFVHASTPGTGVIVSKLFGSYFGNTFVGATRLIK